MHANPDAEQYVLGCILMDQNFLAETDLTPDQFFVGRHQDMFRNMLNLRARGERIDFLALSEFDREGTQEVFATVPTTRLFRHYEKLVLDSWRRRMALAVMEEARMRLDETQDMDAIANAIQQLTTLEEAGVQEEYDIGKSVDAVVEELENDDGEMKGLVTGLKTLDAYTGGWQKEKLIIFGARPGVGKTTLALHTLRHAALNDVVCTMFSLEMSDKEQIIKLLSAEGFIDVTKMRAPKRFFDSSEWAKLKEAKKAIKRMKLAIYDKPSVSLSEIRTRVRARKNAYPNDKHLLVVDYLQLMKGSDKRQSRHEQVGEISRELKMIAREYQIPVIALAQVNRNSANSENKRPRVSDLRESGNIEQDADIVLLLHDPEIPGSNMIELILGKNRNGRPTVIEAAFLKEFNRFYDLPKKEGS